MVFAGLDTVLRCLLHPDEVPSGERILFSHQLGPLARVSLAFFFVAVPVVVAIWDYYGFLVCRDGERTMKFTTAPPERKNLK
jgi:hypothetical protein